MLTRLIIAATLALSPLPAAAEDDHDHDHLSEAAGLRLLHAWTRATTADSALVFVEIANTGDETHNLTGGESPNADTATLVGFRLDNGKGTYLPLPGLPVAPGTDLDLTPEGLAIRLDGLSGALSEGDGFPMEIHFGELHLGVSVAVEAAGATRHSHAGHAH